MVLEQDKSHRSESELNPSKPAKKRGSKTLYWILGFIAFCGIVLLGFGHLTSFLAGKLVKSQVETYTKGVYTVSFEDVKINWANSTIDLIEFEYTKINPIQKLDTEIEYATKLASVKLESISGIYFEQALHVEQFVLEYPKVSINQYVQKQKNQNFSFKTGNFYKTIQGFVKSFEIDNFQVNHLTFDYQQFYGQSPQHYHVSDLSFGIFNFKIDSATIQNDENFFFTESVELKILDQVIDLGDGVHQMKFDSLKLSTSNNNIEVYGFLLDSLNANQQNPKSGAVNRYNMEVPYCGIIGLDFLKAYQRNVLEVDSILFLDMDIYANLGSLKKDGTGKVKIDSAVNNGAIELLLGVFDRYELKKFKINNTQVALNLESGNDKVEIHDLNFEFSGYQLDSTALNEDSYYPVFDGLSLSVSKPIFKLPNKDRLLAKQLKFSTFDSLLVINDVVLRRAENADKQKNNFKIESIELHGVKPKDIVNNNQIILNKLNILNPSFKLFKSGNQKKNIKFNFESLLAGKIKNIEIKRLNVINGKVDFENGGSSVNKSQLTLDGFAFNKKELKRNRFLFSKRARVSLDKVKSEIPGIQHVLDVGEIRLDSRNGRLQLLKWKLYPSVSDSADLKFIANVDGDDFSVEGIAYSQLTNYKNINLNNLKISSLDAIVNILINDTLPSDTNKFGSKIAPQISELLLQNVRVDDVNLLIQKNGKSVAKFSNGFLHTDSLVADSHSLNNGEFVMMADSVSFGLDKLNVPLSQINHTFYVGSIRQSKQSFFELNGLNIRPFPGAVIADSMSKIMVNIPVLTVDSFDVFGKSSLETFHVGNVNINSPNVRLTLPKVKKKTGVDFKFPEKLPLNFVDQVFKAIDVESIEIQNGKLQLRKNELDIKFNELDLSSSNWYISKTSNWSSNKFLYADQFKMVVSEIEYKIPGLKFDFQLDSINYQFNPNLLTINGVAFNSRKDKMEKTGAYLSFKLPKIEFEEPNLFKYLTDSILSVSKIKSYDGLFVADIYEDTSRVKRPLVFPKEFPGFNGVSEIELHELDINKMDVQIRTHKNGVTVPLEMDHFNLEVDSFHVKPREKADSNRLFWSNDVRLNVQNVYTTVDNGLYEIGTDKLSLSTQKDSIGLRGISFVPTVPRLEYALHKGGYQKDVFNVNARQLIIHDFNFFKAVYDGKLEGRELKLNKTELSVFKDKRNLIPEYSYKAIIPQKFKDLPVKISFDSVNVTDLHIRYDEFPKKSRVPGSILLTHSNITAKNVTNDTIKLEQDSTLKIKMNSRFLDASDLKLSLNYNMLNPYNRFTMKSSLDTLDATLINNYIIPAYSAKLLSADVDKMNLTVLGNDSIAGGKMGLFYDNLKFEFIDDDGQKQKKLRAWIGNNVVVSSKNKYHYFKKSEDVFFVRDDSKGWINYLIKIHLHGVEANAGINKNQGKEAKNAEKIVWRDFEKKYRIERKAAGRLAKERDKKLRKDRKKQLKTRKKENKKQQKLDKKEAKQNN
ncbi:MAG: hypothetical protein ACPGRC_08250 [Salibacteraceae bacterium]